MSGAPTRIRPEALRRLMAGEAPESVSPTWPAFGEIVDHDGRRMREVTFVADAARGTDVVMVHVNGVTDGHRDDIGPALLERVPVPGSRLHAIAYLLPDDLIASYRLVSLPAIARDAGATRAGWLRIHEAGEPDPRNPRRLPNPLGRSSSVLVAPGARMHPAWDDARAPVRSLDTSDIALEGERFGGRRITVMTTRGDERTADRLIVLLDGENWCRVGVRRALERAPESPGDVMLVPSGTLEERSAVLPHPEHAADLVSAALDVVRREGLIQVPPPDRVVVAGQSYGGLAAAAVVCLRPDLARTGVVQSGSFHFRAGEEPRAPAGEFGDLVNTLGGSAPGALGGRRLVVQSGTEESGMTALAEVFASTASAAGAAVARRTYSGGHDYAWWRTGLFDALDDPLLAEG